MREFVNVHLADVRGKPLEVLDFGSQVVGAQSLSYAGLIDDPNWTYRGLDIEAGHNVDIVVSNAYDWPEVQDDSVDLVISGQAFEHVEYFWASFFEIVRVLRPGGVATIIAPSGGFEHRFPVDCWRFYPDGFAALARYARVELIDVFTDWNHGDWADSILVVEKPIWDDDQRTEFLIRSGMQRALLADGAVLPDPAINLAAAGAPSVLRGRTVGALTEVLRAKAEARIEAESAIAAAALEAEATARETEIEAAVAERTQRAVDERLHAITPLRLYGTARRGVARVVGEKGRALYKTTRGRA